MTLSEWIKNNKIKPSRFAELIEVKPVSIHRYLNGQRIPLKPIMTKIKAVTNGEVTANDFYQ